MVGLIGSRDLNRGGKIAVIPTDDNIDAPLAQIVVPYYLAGGVLVPAAQGSGGGGAGDASQASQTVQVTAANLTNTELGALTETAPASDTASAGLNGRLQRIAQRLTSLIALLPTALGAGGGLKIDGSGTALPISAASLPLPAGAATNAALGSPFQAGGSIGNTTFASAVANGANTTLGAIADTAYTDTTGAASGTVIGLLKGWFKLFAARFLTSGYGSLLVSSDATTSFADAFDGGTVNVTDIWTTQNGGAGAVTQANGKLNVLSGTSTLDYASIRSQMSFAPSGVAPQLIGFTVQVEFPILANLKRFWGMGTVPATPTVAVPLTDGFGFELTEAGVFRAVVYASGVLLTLAPLTAPVDANQHGYAIIYRADSIFFYIDTLVAPVAVIPYVAPNQTTLPLAMVSVNAATPPTAGQAFSVSLATLGDYGKNTNQISDGTFPWRKATVKKASTPAAVTDLSLVVAAHPLNQATSVNSAPTQLLSQPSAISIAGTTQVAWQVEGGVPYFLTLTNAPGATTAWVATVTFQSSLYNVTWININAFPIGTPTAQVSQTATAVGLWMIDAPAGTTVYLRANATAYTSGTIYALLTPVNLGNAVPLPWVYSVTSGQTIVGPLDVSGLSELAVQLSVVTTTVLTAQGTNDPTLVAWDTLPVQEIKTSSAGAITITAAGTYRIQLAGYKWFRLQCTTTGTVLTVQGVSARLGTPVLLTGFGNAVGAVILSGTVTTVATLTTLANGQTAHSAASTGSPVRIGGRVNTAVDTTLVAGDASDLFMTTGGAVVEKPFSVPELDWQASSGITALATTTSTALKTAGAAGVRNYCTGAQLYNTSATVSTTASILDGATVIWTGYLPATTAALPIVDLQCVFPTPLRGTAATAINIQLGTTAASVYYNAQGYQAP